MIDLRSDTVTRPTPEMRERIARAEVGDDVFGEDPAVNLLQERTAELLGKEAALFVASGTMGNVAAVRAHTRHGDEVILDTEAHIVHYEAGSAAAVSGVQFWTVPGRAGAFTARDVGKRVRPDDVHAAPTTLICMENTHNRAGGTVFPIEEMEGIGAFARERGIRTHLDGARLWNAAVASGVPEARWAAAVDSVTVCLSKGLGAPVGSVLAGSADFIRRARRVRKMLGGGMRQAGVLAAAGLYALEHHRERLADDHAHARLLAETLNRIPGFSVEMDRVQTNIIYADVSEHRWSEAEIVRRMAEKEVLFLSLGAGRIRLVTHLDVSRGAAEEAAGRLEEVLV
ncbi:MAG: low-specificity L-threonine aldolase [Candidatus Eisenbacteria bacterium]|nr:low-specificity L-threonine aldolase [Candidatus Eisenbacteria bacterium]